MKHLITLLAAFLVFMTPAFAGESKDSCCKEKAGAAKESCCKVDCKSCAEMCKKMLAYCLKKGGKHADPKHINTMKDCIALCTANADLASRSSKYQAKIKEQCAKVCAECAKSCEALNDKELKACVDKCNECASLCGEGEHKK